MPKRPSSASGAAAPAGAVAAGHSVTAGAAGRILAVGGNAFDAAIAALWAACAAEPVLASPAGGGFLVARPAGRPAEVFDFFVSTPLVKAPAAAVDFRAVHADFGTTVQEFRIGAGAVATPGFVPGLFAVHEALGSMAMADLIAPAVAAARDGVAVTAFQAEVARIVAPIVTATDAARALFEEDGALVCEGCLCRNPELAATLEALARSGPDLIRTGALARSIVDAVETRGGHLSLDDLASYEVIRRPPLVRPVGDASLAINPPPAAGGVLVCLILGLLAGTGAAPRDLARAVDAADAIRRDASRGSGMRVAASLADALARIAGRPAPRGTTHVSVVDAAGNAAAATVSNGEGNGQVVGGFMLNNMLGEEELSPGGFHAWEPGIRLASMMAPALLDRDGGVVALGSGGSNRIRSAMAAVIARLVAGEPLEAAVAAPRLHVERGHLDFEDLLAPEDRAGLVADFADHRAWDRRSVYFGGVHAVERRADGGLAAAGDPRRAGVGLIA